MLHATHAGCHFDDLTIELAAVVADLLDFALQLALELAGLFVLIADRLQFLIALIECVKLGRAFRWRRRRDRAGRR